MESQTKITMANVRVSLSFQYNTFEISLGIENESGLSVDEIELYRMQAQEQASNAVSDYKLTLEAPPQFTKTPSKPAKQVINVTKVSDDDGSEIGVKDNAEISEIAKLPLYTKHRNA